MMRVASLTLYPIYGIPEQIRRRIGVNAGAKDLGQLSAVVGQHGANAATNADFGQAIGEIVGYDSSPTGFERPLVDISGAGESGIRMQYGPAETGMYNWIAVIVPNPINETRSIEQRFIMTGYTSRAEASILGNLPDDMRLFINDIYCISVAYGIDGQGQRYPLPESYRVLDNYVMSQTLQDQLTGTLELDVNPISMVQNAEIQRKMMLGDDIVLTPTNQLGVGADQTVFSPNFQKTPQLLAAQMTNPEGLVTTLAKGYIHSVSSGGDEHERTTLDQFFGSTGSDVESYLRGQTVQRNLSNHELIQAMRTALSQVDGVASSALGMKGNFTLGNLLSAVTNTSDVRSWICNSVALGKHNSRQMAMENTDEWVSSNGFSTPGKLVAYELSTLLGPIMSRNLTGACVFTFDNRQADMLTPAVVAVVPESLESTSRGQLAPMFAQRLLRDLQQLQLKISKHNRIPFHATIKARLGTIIRVEITMEGGMPEYLSYASFMSNRMHVGITTNNEYVGQLGKSVKNVMAAIDDGYESHTRSSNLTTHSLLVNQVQNDSPFSLAGNLDLGTTPFTF